MFNIPNVANVEYTFSVLQPMLYDPTV